MPSPILAAPRLSDTIAARLEQRILEGSWKPGDRLPSERDLAADLGISRPSLREAIQKLVAKGLVSVRHGGGTFVTDRLEAALVNPWQELLGDHPGLRRDLLEFRHMLESEAAALAAHRATDADIERLDASFTHLEQVYGGAELPQVVAADVRFHQVVAESAHNALIGHMTASLLKLIHEDMGSNMAHLYARPDLWNQLLDQHRSIWRAVREHRPDEARAAARHHIGFVQESMAESDASEQRERIARRRLSEEAGTTERHRRTDPA